MLCTKWVSKHHLSYCFVPNQSANITCQIALSQISQQTSLIRLLFTKFKHHLSDCFLPNQSYPIKINTGTEEKRTLLPWGKKQQQNKTSYPQICSADPQGCPGLPTGPTHLLAANITGPCNVCTARVSDLISPFPLNLTRHSTPLSMTAHTHMCNVCFIFNLTSHLTQSYTTLKWQHAHTCTDVYVCVHAWVHVCMWAMQFIQCSFLCSNRAVQYTNPPTCCTIKPVCTGMNTQDPKAVEINMSRRSFPGCPSKMITFPTPPWCGSTEHSMHSYRRLRHGRDIKYWLIDVVAQLQTLINSPSALTTRQTTSLVSSLHTYWQYVHSCAFFPFPLLISFSSFSAVHSLCFLVLWDACYSFWDFLLFF